MSRIRTSLFPAALAAAAMVVTPVLLCGTKSAHADVTVRVGGKVKVRVGTKKRVRAHRHRPHRIYRTPAPYVGLHLDGGLFWSGGIYVGPRYAPPPPPPPVCNCPDGPPPPPPVARPIPPRPVPVHRPVRVSAPRLPRLGVGVFASAIDVDDRMQGEGLGVLARLRLTERLYLEAELSKAEMSDDGTDRSVGVSALYDFSPRSRWSFHVLGGVGVTRSESPVFDLEQGYGEIGGGLTWRLSRRLHLAADLRGGVRGPSFIEEPLLSDAPRQAVIDVDDEDSLYRARISAIAYF